jgi:predicted regulator of Ras-like GTPase activity (Roadblock/LC7/MglB family)
MKGVDFHHLTRQDIYLGAAILLAIIAIVVGIVLVRRWRAGRPGRATPAVDDRPVDLSSRLGKLIDGINPAQDQAEATAANGADGAASPADEGPSLVPARGTAMLDAATVAPLAGVGGIPRGDPAGEAAVDTSLLGSSVPSFAEPAEDTAPLGVIADFSEPALGTTALGATASLRESVLGATASLGEPLLGMTGSLGEPVFDTARLGSLGGTVTADGPGRADDETAALRGAQPFAHQAFHDLWQPVFIDENALRVVQAGGGSLLGDRRGDAAGRSWQTAALSPLDLPTSGVDELSARRATMAEEADSLFPESAPEAALPDGSGWDAFSAAPDDGWASAVSDAGQPAAMATEPLLGSIASLQIVEDEDETEAGEQGGTPEREDSSDWTHRLSVVGQVEADWAARSGTQSLGSGELAPAPTDEESSLGDEGFEGLSRFPIGQDMWADSGAAAPTAELEPGAAWDGAQWPEEDTHLATLDQEEAGVEAAGEAENIWPELGEPEVAPFPAYEQAQIEEARPAPAVVPPALRPAPQPEPAPQPQPMAARLPRDMDVGEAETALLETYLAAVGGLPGVVHSAVVRRDGVGVAGSLQGGPQDADLEAVLAAALASSARCTAFVDLGTFEGLTVAAHGGMLLLVETGPLAMLAVLTDKDAKLGPLRRSLRRHVEAIKEVLATTYVS